MIAVTLVIAAGANTPVSAIECNDSVATPTYTYRCFEGRWCDYWECRPCPECVNFCACDQSVYCLCNWQWWWLNFCWNMESDDGGIGKLPSRLDAIQETADCASCSAKTAAGSTYCAEIDAGQTGVVR